MKHLFLKTCLMVVMLLVGVGTTWGAAFSGTFNKITTTDALTTGKYVIVGGTTANAMGAYSTYWASTALGTTINNDKTKITNPDETVVWDITKDGINYIISQTSSGTTKYVGFTGTSNNNNSFGTTNTDDKTKFTASVTSGTFTFANVNYTSRQLKYNSSSPRFSNYSGQTALTLFKLESTPTNYTVTVSNSIENGTVTASPTSAAAGAKVTLTATPSTGYEFGSWNVTNASTSAAITVTNNQFTMPAANVNVNATFNAVQGGGDEPSGDGTTYNFADMTDFSSWGTSYEKKTTTFSDGAYVELASANKSTTTITDCPVTKGGDVIFKAPEGKKISSLTFTCTQWTTKTQTITLNTSSNGTDYTATSTTSSNFVLSASNLTDVTAVKFTFSSASNQVGIKSINVVYADDDDDDSDPELTLIGIEATGTPAEFWKGDEFNHNGITVTALWDDESETDVTSSCSFTGYNMSTAGQQTVTVTYQGETCQYNIEVKTIANTQANAYTVAQAKAIIDAGKDLATEVYVKGTVSEIVTAWSDQYKNITYNISDDGETTSQQFQLYRCATNGAEVGDDVVAYGTLTKHNETYEFAAGNTIVDIQKLKVATLSIADITVPQEEEINPVITTNIVGEYSIQYETDNDNVVRVYSNGTELYTGLTGTATITATISADGYKPAQTTFKVTVTQAWPIITRLTLSGEPTKKSYTIGDAFDPAGLSAIGYEEMGEGDIDVTGFVTWTTDPEVLNTAGPVTVAVTATYTTFRGSYSDTKQCQVTVNKKDANISFAPAALDVEVGKNITLEPTTTPADAEISYTITEGSENVSIEGAVVTGVAEGTATIRANYAGNGEYDEASTTVTINVIPAVTKVTFDLSKDETTTATESELSWVTTEVTMLAEKGTSGTNTNNYYPGTEGKTYTSTRFYSNSTLTITPAAGITITKVEYTATTTGYATVLSSSTWNNASASANETLVTITPTDGTKAFSATLSNTTGATSVVVYYTGEAAPALSSIALSGTYPTVFNKGDEFSHEGMTVTAKYTDGSDEDVTSSATFSGYDMNTLGEQTVTVSYTEDEITKTAQYNITVNKAPFDPTIAAEGYEVVDFTTLEPYKSLVTNGTVTIEEYEGTSFAMTFAKPQGSSTPTKYYENGSSVRAYAGNTITITGAESITNVDIAWTAAKGEDAELEITGIGSTTVVVTFANTCSFKAITVGYKKFNLTVTDAGYATLCLPFNATKPEGAAVYTGKYNQNGTVTLNEVTNGKLKSGEGYIVANEGSHTFCITSDVVETPENNNLKGVTERTQLTADRTIYIFANQSKGVGFYILNQDAYLAANKAYLQIPDSESAREFVGFGDGETAIENIIVEPMKDGKYLQNGKIFIIKNGVKYNVNGQHMR